MPSLKFFNSLYKAFVIIFLSFILISCNKNDPEKKPGESKNEASNDDETDTALTPQEAFSYALVQDILGDNEEDELQIYLEETIYPEVSKSNKVTLDRISASVFLLTYDDNGKKRDIMIRKFYNPLDDEFVFEKEEVNTDTLKRLE